MTEPVIALAMVGRTVVHFDVLTQWIHALRQRPWPGPTFLMPEIYAAGAWTGVTPLRNLCTYRALQDKSWDYLLWIDADHRVNHALFGRLQEHAAERLAIVGGPYFGRSWPFEIQAFSERHEDGVSYVPPQVLIPALRNPAALPDAPRVGTSPWPVLPVAGCGTGCMLIRRDLLERMAEVHGHVLNIWRVERLAPDAQLRLLEGGESISGVMTEDILFCLDAADHLGEQTWLDLDPRMETGHIGEETRDRRHYLASHVVPEGANVDQAALKRAGYQLVDTSRERARNLRREGR